MRPHNAILRGVLLSRCVRAMALIALTWLVAAVPAAMGQVTRYAFSNFAGQVGGPGSTDGTGSAARFNFQSGAAVDATGNVFVADTGNHTIRKITPAGVVTTFAGTAGHSGSVNGTGAAALFNNPQGVAVDIANNVYVADTGNHTIRKITPGGTVTTLAGFAGVSGSNDGTGTAARFYLPSGVAVDPALNVYVADTRNYTIRKITPAGVVTTLAGSPGQVGSTDAPAGPGNVARFNSPMGVAVDTTGIVYVADTGNHTIRRITPAGFVATLAGLAGTSGSADDPAPPPDLARFNGPQGVAVDGAFNVYIADTGNHTVRVMTAAGVVSTLAGTAGISGAADATGPAAQFYHPDGLAVESGGANVYVADTFNLTIRKVVTATRVVTTMAGMSGGTGIADGSGTAARFNNPLGVATDTGGNTYVADTGNHTIRMITPAGVVTTYAGSPGNFGSTDGTGAAARFFSPSGVAVDTASNVYVADTGNHTIRRIAPGGVVTTLAGLAGNPGTADGAVTVARFRSPQGVAVDALGDVYVADTGNHVIREITGGVVSTLAGTPGLAGSRNGVSVVASGTAVGALTRNSGFAVGSTLIGTSGADGAGSILAGDLVTFSGDSRTYVVTTGTPDVRGGSTAGVTTDGTSYSVGSTFITTGTTGTGTISAGDIVTFAGDTNGYLVVTGGPVGSSIVLAQPGLLTAIPAAATAVTVVGSSIKIASPGLGQAIPAAKTAITVVSSAQFNSPQGLAVDALGNVYVADTTNNTIRMVTPAGAVTTLAGTAGISGTTDGAGASAQFKNPRGVALDVLGNVYVADTGNYTVRKITPAGLVTTIGGGAGILGSIDGAGIQARFYNPSGIALDASNNVFVADARNNRISRGTPFTAFGRRGNTDLNGDGSDDLVFQNSAGQLYGWYLNGVGGVYSYGWLFTGGLGSWSLVGIADMNNDGNVDFIFQYSSGQVYVWYLNGSGGVISTAFLSTLALGDWRVVGVADMDNDGNADLVFQNTVGQIYVWRFNGAGGFLSGFSVPAAAAGLGDWRVVGLADIDRDGNVDIIFQNTIGQIYAWRLDGSGGFLSGISIYPYGSGGWRVARAVDINGDGYVDLVFQNSVGQIYVWLLNGTGGITSTFYLYTSGTGDFRIK